MQRQADLERAGAEGGAGFASSADVLGPGRQPTLPVAGLSPGAAGPCARARRAAALLEKSGADDGDNNFSLTYTGKDAGDARWLQFIWREVVGADDKGAAVPVKGSITSTGGTYDLTDNGAFDKNGTPGKKNHNTDCPNASDPFYEAFGEADRTAESTTMIDLPAARTDKVIEALDKGAKKVASRAHFHTFLVKGKKVTFATNINVTWTFLSKAEATSEPRGVHTVKDSGAASGLPATIAERFHEQYPAFKDIG